MEMSRAEVRDLRKELGREKRSLLGRYPAPAPAASPVTAESQKTSADRAREAKLKQMGAAYDAAQTYPDDFKKGGKVASASKRADGIAQRGKTRGTIVACKGGKM
jgi:hypothetical protein